MKSTLRVDVDYHTDKPVIKIQCYSSTDDLRDKTLESFLRKLGFTHAHFGQKAQLEIEYSGWGGSCGGEQTIGSSYEEFTITPIQNSAKCYDDKGKEIPLDKHPSNNRVTS